MKFNSKVIVFLLFIILIISGIIIYDSTPFQRLIYPLKYERYIWSAAYEYDIDPRLIAAVIYAESGFREQAKSHKEAIGLMQITPNTGRWIASRMGITDYNDKMLEDPIINIRFGAWYLKDLEKEFNGDLLLMLAAYNAGRGNVRQWLTQGLIEPGKGVDGIPFKETQNYIVRVLNTYEHYKKLYEY